MRVKVGLFGLAVALGLLGFLAAGLAASGASAHSSPCHTQHTCPSDHAFRKGWGGARLVD
jgi:hypothetical protein